MARQRARIVSFGNFKIHAIKLVRELSRTGLREAKDLVEGGGSFEFESSHQTQAAIDEAARQGIRLQIEGAAMSAASSPAPRGTDSGQLVVRYDSGPQKINAIKLVRELTGVGLKDAKDLVEQRGEIRRVSSRAEADELIRRFSAIGSTVVVESGGSSSSPTQSPSSDAGPPTWSPSASASPGGFDSYVRDDDDF